MCGRCHMFQQESWEAIIRILQKQKSASAQSLARELFVSNATIRRDLELMEKKGMLNRVWGGATLTKGMQYEPPAFMRARENQEKKESL